MTWKLVALIVLGAVLCAAAAADAPAASPSGLTAGVLPEATDADRVVEYRKHLARKRREQLAAAEAVWAKPDYVQRFGLVKAMLDELFRVLRRSQRALAGVDLAALPAVPKHDTAVLEPLVLAWENSLLLGDLALRLPDMVHDLVDGYPVRVEVATWAAGLGLASDALDDHHKTQLRLLQQELHLGGVAPDPAYTNPYRERDILAAQQRHDAMARAVRAETDAARARRARRAPALHCPTTP